MEQTADTVQASSTDMAQKTFSAAESNLRSSLDDAERLVPAKYLQEAAQIQSEFVRTQAEARARCRSASRNAARRGCGRSGYLRNNPSQRRQELIQRAKHSAHKNRRARP